MNQLLEDEFGDIVRKARTGLGLDAASLSAIAGVEAGAITAFESYARLPSEEESNRLARALNLHPGALWRIASGAYLPSPLVLPEGIELETFTFPEMNSKGYLIHLARFGETLLVDPGGSPGSIRSALAARRWRLSAVLVTHGHSDHVAALDALLGSIEAPVYAHPDEWQGKGSIATLGDGELRIGEATVQVLSSPGHTPGGLAFVVEGIAFSGDTLFAGSLGGPARSRGAYERLLASARRLLELSPETRILPGHGPATTVQEEREHNPFLAGRS